jgi:hypothetical protein
MNLKRKEKKKKLQAKISFEVFYQIFMEEVIKIIVGRVTQVVVNLPSKFETLSTTHQELPEKKFTVEIIPKIHLEIEKYRKQRTEYS